MLIRFWKVGIQSEFCASSELESRICVQSVDAMEIVRKVLPVEMGWCKYWLKVKDLTDLIKGFQAILVRVGTPAEFVNWLKAKKCGIPLICTCGLWMRRVLMTRLLTRVSRR